MALISFQNLEAHRQRLRDRGQNLPRTLALAPILNHNLEGIDSSKCDQRWALVLLTYLKELENPYFDDGRGHSPSSAMNAIEIKFGMPQLSFLAMH